MDCVIRQQYKHTHNQRMEHLSEKEEQQAIATAERYTVIEIDDNLYSLRTNTINRKNIIYMAYRTAITKLVQTCFDVFIVLGLYAVSNWYK